MGSAYIVIYRKQLGEPRHLGCEENLIKGFN
nr:MAG TPA: hypothetical protein [Caudoviricetes sp.]